MKGPKNVSVTKTTTKHEWYGEKPTQLAIDFAQVARIGPGSTVLDEGCGYGRNSEYFAGLGANVDAINIDEGELEIAKQHSKGGVNYLVANAGNLPFPNNHYDAIMDAGCSHMCDAETQEKIAQEAARVLRPGGYLMYFGFSKSHPKYLAERAKDPNYSHPQFRDLEDIKKLYGQSFEMLEVQPHGWEAPSEYGRHEGLNILMRRR